MIKPLHLIFPVKLNVKGDGAFPIHQRISLILEQNFPHIIGHLLLLSPLGLHQSRQVNFNITKEVWGKQTALSDIPTGSE